MKHARMLRLAFAVLVAGTFAVALPPTFAQHARLTKPEELGLLEAPDRADWQQPERVMDALQIGDGSIVADLGAGGGWFTVRLARRVGPTGRVYAEDVQPQMIEAIQRRVAREELRNVVPRLGRPDDPLLPANTLDAVLILDVYHEIEKPITLLRNVRKALKSDGRIGIVNFTKEGGGPGPPIADRVDSDRVIRDAAAAGLALKSRENFLRYEYLLIFEPAAE